MILWSYLDDCSQGATEDGGILTAFGQHGEQVAVRISATAEAMESLHSSASAATFADSLPLHVHLVDHLYHAFDARVILLHVELVFFRQACPKESPFLT